MSGPISSTHYIFSRFKTDCLKTDEYGQLLYSYLFSTVMYPDLYIPAELTINRYPSLLDKDMFYVALNICRELDSSTVRYTNTVLIRYYRLQDVDCIVGYIVYNDTATAQPTQWIEYKGIIYDAVNIYRVYSTGTDSDISTIARQYMAKSITESYYYSKILYGENGITKLPIDSISIIDEETDLLINAIVDRYSHS